MNRLRSQGSVLSRPEILLALLVIIAAILFFYHLGERDLWDAAETRAAQIAREMLESGDYVVPNLNGEVIATKPPIFHYLLIVSYKIFGVNEFAARLPSALAGIAVTIITFLLGMSIFGPRGAFISGLILILSSKLWWHARSAQMDTTFTALIACAQLCAYRLLHGSSRPRIHQAVMFALMGLATVTKGLLGFAVPIGTCIAFAAWERRWKLLRNLKAGRGVLIFLVFALPWFVFFILRAGADSAEEMFFRQQFTRFFSAFDRKQPFYFYFGEIFEVLFPWSIFIPAFILLFFKGMTRELKARLRFPLAWFGVTFILLSLSQAKRGAYLLPLFPAAALLIGALWEHAIAGLASSGADRSPSGKGRSWLHTLYDRKFEISLSFFGFALGGAAVGAPTYFVLSDTMHEAPPQFVLLCLLAAFTGFGLLLATRKQAFRAAFALICVAAGFFFIYYTDALLPDRTWKRSVKPAAQRLVQLAGADGRAASYDIDRPGLYFYADRRILLLETPEGLADALQSTAPLTCLILDEDYQEIVSVLPRHCIASDQEHIRKKKALIISNRCPSS